MTLDKKELVEYFFANRHLFCNGITRFGLNPDDVIQECCLRILDSKAQVYEIYNGQRINYLRSLVRNCCINLNKRKQLFTPLNGYDVIEEEKPYPELLEIVNKSCMSDIKKKVIYGHFWRDLTYKQLSKEMNISDGTLKSSFCRSKKELKLLFQ